MTKWSELSMKQKGDLFGIYVKQGYSSLDKIKEHYNNLSNTLTNDPTGVLNPFISINDVNNTISNLKPYVRDTIEVKPIEQDYLQFPKRQYAEGGGLSQSTYNNHLIEGQLQLNNNAIKNVFQDGGDIKNKPYMVPMQSSSNYTSYKNSTELTKTHNDNSLLRKYKDRLYKNINPASDYPHTTMEILGTVSNIIQNNGRSPAPAYVEEVYRAQLGLPYNKEIVPTSNVRWETDKPNDKFDAIDIAPYMKTAIKELADTAQLRRDYEANPEQLYLDRLNFGKRMMEHPHTKDSSGWKQANEFLFFDDDIASDGAYYTPLNALGNHGLRYNPEFNSIDVGDEIDHDIPFMDIINKKHGIGAYLSGKALPKREIPLKVRSRIPLD